MSDKGIVELVILVRRDQFELGTTVEYEGNHYRITGLIGPTDDRRLWEARAELIQPEQATTSGELP
jgi:hypothetical protein